MPDLQKLIKEIKNHKNKSQASISQRFFKTGPGEYGAGDIFWGLKVPLQRQIAAKYEDLSLVDIQQLLNSKIHEFRLVGLLILTAQYQAAKNSAAQEEIVKFYLKNSRRVNNWDLVDLSVYKILGDFLVKKQAAGQVELVSRMFDCLIFSPNIWERRMAIVATFAFMKKGKTEETFKVARRLQGDKHDLINKAVGWMLREAGKRGGVDKLRVFLNANYKNMSRLSLRYAIERLSARDRKHYLSKN